ncbi:hypothetical protein HY627_02470 [Candidatus Uhrbacteria bacterium]|nr:hypothetical protein [Candidatus Uhrbacteria bacterium]
MKLYRFITSSGEGVFGAGKRLLPENLVDEAWENRKWMPKPNLPEGEYDFYMTSAGKEKYEQTLFVTHRKYLDGITCVEVDADAIGQPIYEDEWQVVYKKPAVSGR